MKSTRITGLLEENMETAALVSLAGFEAQFAVRQHQVKKWVSSQLPGVML